MAFLTTPALAAEIDAQLQKFADEEERKLALSHRGPNMALQRTRCLRYRSGRSLGSRLNARPLGARP